MTEHITGTTKVAIAGAGSLGATMAHALWLRAVFCERGANSAEVVRSIVRSFGR